MDLLMPVWQLALVALASSTAVVFVLGLPTISNTLWVMLLLGAAWALRLSLFITRSSWPKTEAEG